MPPDGDIHAVLDRDRLLRFAVVRVLREDLHAALAELKLHRVRLGGGEERDTAEGLEEAVAPDADALLPLLRDDLAVVRARTASASITP
jgi:hypothetical protein